MSCSVEFDRHTLQERLGQAFIRTDYRYIRENVLYEQEKALFPATQELVERKLQLVKLKDKIGNLGEEYERIRQEREIPLKEFRYSTDVLQVRDVLDQYFQLHLNVEAVDEQLHEARRKITIEIENLEGNQTVDKKTYVLACTNADCKGMLSRQNTNDHGHHICSICDTITCNQCKMGVSSSSDHECDEDVLKTIAYMDSTSKPCPSCAVPIHKISGCFAAGTIIPLSNGTNVMANEIECDHILNGDDGTDRVVLSTMTGTDQLYMITQSNGCSYEVNTYHMLCLMREDQTIILMTVNVYLDLSDEEKKKLFGYKIIDDDVILSSLTITPTQVGRFYGFTLSDNQRFALQDGTIAHNCSQMFCTGCHASFDWNSLRLNNGALHNPHHANWLRENRDRPREVGDIQCGRELNIDIAVSMVDKFENIIDRKFSWLKQERAKLLKDDSYESDPARVSKELDEFTRVRTDASYMFESIRVCIHHTHVTINSLNRNQHGHHTNQSLRVNLLTNEMSESDFKREIQRRDKATSKRNDLLHVVMTFRDATIDITSGFVGRSRKTFDEWVAMIDELKALETYVNNCFIRVGKTYTMAQPYEIMSDRAIR
jgi:hypothetical protein